MFDAVATGPVLITTVVVAALDTHPDELVTIRLYTPPVAAVAFAIVGFCTLEVKPFGPVHAYVVMPAGPPVRFTVEPTQTGPLFVAVATGRALITTVVVAAIEVHPVELVTTRLYAPAAAAVTPAIDGLWRAEVKPFGPVHA